MKETDDAMATHRNIWHAECYLARPAREAFALPGLPQATGQDRRVAPVNDALLAPQVLQELRQHTLINPSMLMDDSNYLSCYS